MNEHLNGLDFFAGGLAVFALWMTLLTVRDGRVSTLLLASVLGGLSASILRRR